MYGSNLCIFSFWWIVPVVMILLCFFMMRGCKGKMISGFGCCGRDWQQAKGKESSFEILDRRYDSGEINKNEYEEKKRDL